MGKTNYDCPGDWSWGRAVVCKPEYECVVHSPEIHNLFVFMNWMEIMQAFTGEDLKIIEILWIKTKPWQGVLFEREKKYKKTTEWASQFIYKSTKCRTNCLSRRTIPLKRKRDKNLNLDPTPLLSAGDLF